MRRPTDRWMLALACAVLCVCASGCAVNPVTGQSQFMAIGQGKELSLGDGAHPDIVHTLGGEYHDAELNRYLGTIVMRLHRCSHRPEMPMEFTMLNTSVVNAFATPAHVYATRGFLARLENEAQFASVMGHELSHVSARHTAKMMSNSVVTGLLLSAGGAVAGDSVGGRLVTGLGGVGVSLMGLSYSRQQEHQSDRVGAYYMALAGWDPRQAVEMQKILASLKTHKATVLDKDLSTHPPSGERIADIEAVIGEGRLLRRNMIQGDGVYAGRWRRRLAHLRKVNSAYGPYDRGVKQLGEGNHKEALRAADEALAMRKDQAPFHRLKGDALRGLKSPAKARDAYKAALARDARYTAANLGLGKAFLDDGNLAAAERQFAAATRGWPSSLEGWYGLGFTRYRLKRYADATPPLEKVAGALPDNEEVRAMLAVCYERTGRSSSSAPAR